MKKWMALFCFMGVAGCSSMSVPAALDRLRPGMDKPAVLDKAGNPTRTFREDGQDHWIYVYFRNDREWLRDVTFEDGKVAKVSRGVAKDPSVKALQNSNSMEDYEKKARAMQRKNKGKFKNLGN
jgi:hypothetical protein